MYMNCMWRVCPLKVKAVLTFAVNLFPERCFLFALGGIVKCIKKWFFNTFYDFFSLLWTRFPAVACVVQGNDIELNFKPFNDKETEESEVLVLGVNWSEAAF